MNRWQQAAATWAAIAALTMTATTTRADGRGQDDLDNALRTKVTAENMRDLNKVIELLEAALDKGLDIENSDFAEQVLAESLLERASQLAAVIKSMPAESLSDVRLQRMWNLAVSDLRRVITYDTAPPQTTLVLAEMLAMPGGEPREARGMLDNLIEGEKFARLSANEQASAYAMRAGMQTQPEQVLADWDEAIKLAPDSLEYRLARAEARLQNDEPDAALEEIDEILASDSQEVAAHLLRAQILRDQEKYDEALASLATAGKLAPNSILPHQYRGEIYRLQGDYDKAIAEFSRVLQMQPGMGLALLRRAEAYLLAEKLDDALADIEAVLQANPDLPVAHGLRAQALAGKDRMAEAISEMKLMVEGMPDQLELKLQLAAYYVVNDQPRQAIEVYSQILSEDDRHFLALRGRGDAYLNIGEHAAAIADFERAIAVEPDDVPLLNNFAWVLATSPDDALRDGKRAIELAEKASKLTDYKMPHILSTLAAAFAEAGDFEHAVEWSQRAVDFNDPEHGPQLANELATYKARKPFRERQTVANQPADDASAIESEESHDGTDDRADVREKSSEQDEASEDSEAPAQDGAEPVGT